MPSGYVTTYKRSKVPLLLASLPAAKLRDLLTTSCCRQCSLVPAPFSLILLVLSFPSTVYGCACASAKRGGAVEPWGVSDYSSCAPSCGNWWMEHVFAVCLCVVHVLQRSSCLCEIHFYCFLLNLLFAKLITSLLS